MSFGSAASRGAPVRRPDVSAACPCGSGDSFGGCCGPVIGGADAPTAERLMRSRYTAFAIGDSTHLLRSWHPRTRPEGIDIDRALIWTGLEIVDADPEAADDVTAAVEFRASWRQGSGAEASAGELHERSRFVRLRGRWHYLDGVVG